MQKKLNYLYCVINNNYIIIYITIYPIYIYIYIYKRNTINSRNRIDIV